MDVNVFDIRTEIFRRDMTKRVTAVLIAEDKGIISGIERAEELARDMRLEFSSSLRNGDGVEPDVEIARVVGDPVQMARAEEVLIGTLSKSSGIATRARQALISAGERCQVISGGWKKMPQEIKELVRQAVSDGGLEARIMSQPFLYIDKNYVRMLGGIGGAMEAVSHLGRGVVIQTRGETASVGEEAVLAVDRGASVVMVDTGVREHLAEVSKALRNHGLRDRARIAFAGNISIDQIESLSREDVDLVDIGYAIVDAPCLPIRFDVVSVDEDS
jgi:nicotinate-nucleotide pyrophosphorylase (carboxylating)